jgi:glucosamine--fructose-6-phosphate aminotransferase (isomerizing)
MPQSEANGLRREIVTTADMVERAIAENNERAQKLAKRVAGETNYVLTGYGPNFATALFGAAKILEATGLHAMAQDTEEWAHLQYFVNVHPHTPTFVISPGGRGHGRAAELIEPMKRIGRIVISITPEDDQTIAPEVEWDFRIAGGLRESFSPLVYPVPTELFAAYLSDVIGETFFRKDTDAYVEGTNTIRTSRMMERSELG